ncbi:hypothetical protein EVAR_46185_1 [Eumeta japonica]|uniref:Uncharacterized protein n=1 Tax=Eumeta variegata TaxID=151549 RepID=A0A4C1WGB9_EUMVA|nr:hypothetical protein EVAR_46185_1 [Eumeta japonica]
MRPSPQRDDWEDTPSQEPPKRRRPGRKRYRRPQVPVDDDHQVVSRRPYFDDSPEPYREKEIQSYETTNPPRRRIKNPNNVNDYWSSGQEVQRPLRRRGQRRRRPTSKTTTDAVPLEPIIQQSDQVTDEIYLKTIEYDRKSVQQHQEKK